MMRCNLLACSCMLVALASGAARAQTPGFTTIDRGDALSRVGFDVGVTLFDDDGGGDATGFRFDVYGQYVTPAGYGGYVLAPVSYASFEDDNADEEVALGNIEVGGLYAIPADTVTFVLRGGLTLPTAADGVDEFTANILSVRPRGTDVATITPQSFWLRAAGSVLGGSGAFFFRGDLGIDMPLTDEYEIDIGLIDVPVELDPLIRLNAGIGVVAGPAAIMMELATIAFTGDDIDESDPADDEEDFESNLAVGVRFIQGQIQPSISFVFPLDDEARDAIDFMFLVGVQGILAAP